MTQAANSLQTAAEHCFNSLNAFVAYMMPNYRFAKHHAEISDALMKCEANILPMLLINAPPRHGKTQLASIFFAAWYIWRNPNHAIMLTSYSQDIANDMGQLVKDILNSPDYQELTGISLTIDSHSKKKFTTTNGCTFFAVGRGGATAGRGAHLLIIDDMVKDDKESRSMAVHKENQMFYSNTLQSRLMKDAKILLMNTRWHVDDLPGFILKTEGHKWHSMIYPAISDAGEALWESDFPLTVLEDRKHSMAPEAWTAQYMQSPIIQGGNIFKRDRFREYETLPLRWDEFFQVWDCAFKGKSDSDYVVGTVWLRDQADLYLVDLVRKHADFSDTLKMFRRLTANHPQTRQKYVEDAANGAALESMLRREIPGIQLFRSTDSKEERAHAVQAYFMSGNVFFPKDEPWLPEFYDELLGFPNVANDDMVDCVTAAILQSLVNLGGYDWGGRYDSDTEQLDEPQVIQEPFGISY